MNSSELVDSGLKILPDQYEVEITESHRFVDASFNDTNNNITSSFQGKQNVCCALFLFNHFTKIKLHRKQNSCEAGRSFNCYFCALSVGWRNRTVRSSMGEDKKL